MSNLSKDQLPNWVTEIAVAFNRLMDKPNYRRSVKDAIKRWSGAHRRWKREHKAWRRKRDEHVTAMTAELDRRVFDRRAKMGNDYKWDHGVTLRQVASNDNRVAKLCAWATRKLRRKCKSVEARKKILVTPFSDSAGRLSHSFGAWMPRELHPENAPRTTDIFPLPTVDDDCEISADEKLVALLAIREVGMRGVRTRSTAGSHKLLTRAAFEVVKCGVFELAASNEPILRAWLADAQHPRRGRPKGTRKFVEKECRKVYEERTRTRYESWTEVLKRLPADLSEKTAKRMYDSYRKSEDAKKVPSTPSN